MTRRILNILSGIQGTGVQNIWYTKHAFGCFVSQTSGVLGQTAQQKTHMLN